MTVPRLIVDGGSRVAMGRVGFDIGRTMLVANGVGRDDRAGTEADEQAGGGQAERRMGVAEGS